MQEFFAEGWLKRCQHEKGTEMSIFTFRAKGLYLCYVTI